MKELITVQSAAQKWSITPRRVQILCNEGRIDGAIKKVEFGLFLLLRQSRLVKVNSPKRKQEKCL